MNFYTVIYVNDEDFRFSTVVFARDSRDAIYRFYSIFGGTEFDYRVVEVLALDNLIDCRIESHETTY